MFALRCKEPHGGLRFLLYVCLCMGLGAESEEQKEKTGYMERGGKVQRQNKEVKKGVRGESKGETDKMQWKDRTIRQKG